LCSLVFMSSHSRLCGSKRYSNGICSYLPLDLNFIW
jgi:hypothetical protein